MPHAVVLPPFRQEDWKTLIALNVIQEVSKPHLCHDLERSWVRSGKFGSRHVDNFEVFPMAIMQIVIKFLG